MSPRHSGRQGGSGVAEALVRGQSRHVHRHERGRLAEAGFTKSAALQCAQSSIRAALSCPFLEWLISARAKLARLPGGAQQPRERWAVASRAEKRDCDRVGRSAQPEVQLCQQQ